MNWYGEEKFDADHYKQKNIPLHLYKPNNNHFTEENSDTSKIAVIKPPGKVTSKGNKGYRTPKKFCMYWEPKALCHRNPNAYLKKCQNVIIF